ncbi:alpha/beta fold hydrolase [Mycobacterium branderi]|uniref:Alpha/beta hydrolase n=1 Tax=Mycobacterium branderi TaxID=43348 RepID=A0A7I7W2T5_9MYCO|nr:alpha/beta hydrolase [Mycobacterium branderi]MCV7232005.1 alpha/beta hydrolase [Mycobacterium branderi]ORA32391.1 alpha/beta hydrolase [Mycobacterium branderi]BBZ11252.1 alpha/beta hydrolase [Mycobacterium branderi]
MDAGLASWLAAGRHFDYLGFDVFYRTEGSGPPLLLIHGYPFNSYDWALIWPELTQRFTVIAPDMMGMGFSAKPVAYEYSVHDHADMHEALLAHLGVGNAHIMAHDIGDSVGQELLARNEFGQQAYGELSIDSITWLNGGMFVESYTPRVAQKLMSRTPLGDIFSHVQNSPLSRRLLEPTLREMFGPNTQPTRQMMDVFNQILDYNDGRRVLHKVGRFINDRYTHRNRWVRAMRQTTVPMRLIDGPVDPNSGAHMARRYAEVIPEPDVVMLDDDIGHWPQLEAPDAVLAHFLTHVESASAR